MYHWIQGCTDESVSIYIFRPHGSKNIVDLDFLTKTDAKIVTPEIVCHDQEPLDFAQNQQINYIDLCNQMHQAGHQCSDNFMHNVRELSPYYENLNFLSMLRLWKPRSIFDRYILLHSEKNSIDVEQFSISAEPAYYWCHGIIARDWYRFAEHDTRLLQPASTKKTFLLYCRAWTDSREYRLKFLDLLVNSGLESNCQTSIMHQDQEQSLLTYQCNNKNFQPANINELLKLPNNVNEPTASADYCATDFVETNISVVLETIADSKKIHLTEKTLRPIACGHPFILLAGPESLEYLKSYGFKTFSPWIDESYDTEQNIVKRMQKIIDEMNRIQQLPFDQKTQIFFQLKNIAEYNKKHFFSNKFFNQIHTELVNNLNHAIDQVKLTRGQKYLSVRSILNKNTDQHSNIRYKRNLETAKVLRKLRQNPATNIKNIISHFPDGFFDLF